MPNHFRRTEEQSRGVHDTPTVLVPGITELHDTIRSWAKRTDVSGQWLSDAILVKAGQVVHVLRQARQRVRAQLYTDAGNSVPVWYSASVINGDPTGTNRPGAAPLAPGSTSMEFHHSGAVYAYATADSYLYVVAEFLAQPDTPHPDRDR